MDAETNEKKFSTDPGSLSPELIKQARSLPDVLVLLGECSAPDSLSRAGLVVRLETVLEHFEPTDADEEHRLRMEMLGTARDLRIYGLLTEVDEAKIAALCGQGGVLPPTVARTQLAQEGQESLEENSLDVVEAIRAMTGEEISHLQDSSGGMASQFREVLDFLARPSVQAVLTRHSASGTGDGFEPLSSEHHLAIAKAEPAKQGMMVSTMFRADASAATLYLLVRDEQSVQWSINRDELEQTLTSVLSDGGSFVHNAALRLDVSLELAQGLSSLSCPETEPPVTFGAQARASLERQREQSRAHHASEPEWLTHDGLRVFVAFLANGACRWSPSGNNIEGIIARSPAGSFLSGALRLELTEEQEVDLLAHFKWAADACF